MAGDSRRNRAFHYAVLVSLALHTLLLLGFPDLGPALRQAVKSAPLVARLLAPEPAAAPEPDKREEPVARAKPVLPPKPQSAPAVEPAPSPPDPQPVSRNPAPASAEPQPVPAAIASAPPSAAAPRTPAPAAPSTEAMELRSADQYRLELIATARRIKERMRYPAQAKDNNWEGDVRLGVSISSSGTTSIAVKRSSQYEVLDRQAIEILRLASDEVLLPPMLRGKESTLRDLVFEYRLKD